VGLGVHVAVGVLTFEPLLSDVGVALGRGVGVRVGVTVGSNTTTVVGAIVALVEYATVGVRVLVGVALGVLEGVGVGVGVGSSTRTVTWSDGCCSDAASAEPWLDPSESTSHADNGDMAAVVGTTTNAG